jgi:transposase-like protein
MRKLRSVVRKSNKKTIRIMAATANAGQFFESDGQPIDPQELLLRKLLPSAVKAFFDELGAEVRMLCGDRYRHGPGAARWGSEEGSVYLGGQKVAIERPRVRDVENNREVALSSYERYQDPKIFEEKVFQEGLRHVSQRDYERGVEKIGGSFGFKKSTISRTWKRATQKQLEQLMNRDLTEMKIVTVFIDGKRFRKEGVVIALGVSESGKKQVLGFYQANTESGASCLGLLNNLERRGLPRSGLLFVVDGGSGLNKALEEKYAVHDPKKRMAVRVRCHVHKWANIEDALGKDSPATAEAATHYWNMRRAEDLAEASAHAQALEIVLRKGNLSALASFQEAKPDLLIIHELGLSAALKRAFSSTNAAESLNSMLAEDTRRVKRWRDSEHFQRWVATAALKNEKRMHRVRGFVGLPALALRLSKLCSGLESQLDQSAQAA